MEGGRPNCTGPRLLDAKTTAARIQLRRGKQPASGDAREGIPRGRPATRSANACGVLPVRFPISLSRDRGRPKYSFSLEAAPGFEPGIRDLQSHALPLGYAAEEESHGAGGPGPSRAGRLL